MCLLTCVQLAEEENEQRRRQEQMLLEKLEQEEQQQEEETKVRLTSCTVATPERWAITSPSEHAVIGQCSAWV